MINQQNVLFEAPKYVAVMLGQICERLTRVYWTDHRQTWDGTSDPEIEGIDWTVTTPREGAPLVRFAFENVEMHWVGPSRQSLATTVSWSTEQWNAWFDQLRMAIEA